jgi:hypothetical protein
LNATDRQIGTVSNVPTFTASLRPATLARMIELMRTNDAVVISFVQSLLRDSGIDCLVADQNMSVLDGSLGILPRRILVAEEDLDEAREILADAGIANEIGGN